MLYRSARLILWVTAKDGGRIPANRKRFHRRPFGPRDARPSRGPTMRQEGWPRCRDRRPRPDTARHNERAKRWPGFRQYAQQSACDAKLMSIQSRPDSWHLATAREGRVCRASQSIHMIADCAVRVSMKVWGRCRKLKNRVSMKCGEFKERVEKVEE